MTRRLAPRRRSTTITAAVLTVVGGVAVAAIGLSPEPAEAPISTSLFRFLLWASQQPALRWLDFDVLETVGNVLLFVPVGIVAFLLIPRRLWVLALLVGPALSTAIELGQWMLLPLRTASVADIAANSLGATIGVGLAAAVSLTAAALSARASRRRAAVRPAAPSLSGSLTPTE